MQENSSDPTYLDKKFKEAQDRYRHTGVGGVLIETDKDKDLEPKKPDAEFRKASKRFYRAKGNVVMLGDPKVAKKSPQSGTRVFGIHPPIEGEK